MRFPSNISQLEKDFGPILMDSRDGDGSGMNTNRTFTRHTFVFLDGSKLFITERISGGQIEYSYYNWIDPQGNEIVKFHSENHDGDMRYQTATEPHHVHPPEDTKIHNVVRYPNFHHQELAAIMEHIFFSLIASKKI